MGRYKPDKRSGLFGIRTVGICTLWNFSSAYDVDMENVGTAVSYDQAVAGDIILYDGHVGIYMGNGQIVNAINSAKGIGILPATYTNIVTVRRLV